MQNKNRPADVGLPICCSGVYGLPLRRIINSLEDLLRVGTTLFDIAFVMSSLRLGLIMLLRSVLLTEDFVAHPPHSSPSES